MKWTYIITQKIKAALALIIVFVLVLLTNLLDKRYFSKLQDSFTSVYEDRLVAENYIFRLSSYLNEKNQLYDQPTQNFLSRNQIINDSIQLIVEKYEDTKLTQDESLYFFSLKKQLEKLMLFDSKLSENDLEENREWNSKFNPIWSNLEALAKIQLTEGKRLITESEKVIHQSNTTFRLELAVLIIIGLIIQALIFTSKSLKPKFNQKSNLN